MRLYFTAETVSESELRSVNGMKLRSLKKDMILIVALLLAGLIILSVILLTGKKGSTVQVRIDGSITAQYPLSMNRTERIKCIGGTNTLVIENGEAYVTEADCPDGICIRTGKISRNGQTIICLPHKVVIEICGDEADNKTDIIVQ